MDLRPSRLLRGSALASRMKDLVGSGRETKSLAQVEAEQCALSVGAGKMRAHRLRGSHRLQLLRSVVSVMPAETEVPRKSRLWLRSQFFVSQTVNQNEAEGIGF